MGSESDAYIAENAGRLSTREMAAALGIGQATVVRRMKKMGLSGKKAGRKGKKAKAAPAAPPAPAPPDTPAPGPGDYLGRMRELRAILYGQLAEAKGANAARVAREYREVCDVIRKEEGGGREESGLSALFDAFR